jgi:hypothetical protein
MLVLANGTPFSIVVAISYSAVTAMFAGMFVLLAGILGRELLPALVVRRGYASDWVCLRPEAEARGLKLLKEWLSPAQLDAYQAHRYFEVVGCDSGNVYRVRHGLQGNVEQLDEGGEQAVCRWCFGPEDLSLAGDTMLAQKIALETDEIAALQMANRLPPRRMVG